jgi:hypothetical protein
VKEKLELIRRAHLTLLQFKCFMSYNASERLISMMFPNNLSLLDSTNQPVEYKGNRPAFAVGKNK